MAGQIARVESHGRQWKLDACNAEACALRTDMNVRARGLSGHSVTEGEVGNVVVDQVRKQPAALGTIRVNGHIDASAVVESQGAMHRGFARRTDRHRFAELLLELRLHFSDY